MQGWPCVRVRILGRRPQKERKVVDGCMQLAGPCLATSETRPFHLTYSTYSVPLKVGQGGEVISCSERYHSSFQSPYLVVSSRLIFLTIQYSRHLSCLYVMTTLPVRGFLGQIAQWRHLRTCIKSTPIRHRTRSHHTSFPSTRRCVIIIL